MKLPIPKINYEPIIYLWKAQTKQQFNPPISKPYKNNLIPILFSFLVYNLWPHEDGQYIKHASADKQNY